MPITMLDPVQQPLDVKHPPAPRLDTLDGKVVGLYSNNKLNSVRLMEMIAEELARDYSFTTREGFYFASRLTSDEEWGDVGECDVVILANGDCGACSSSGIANAIDLEKRGIPALLITTPPFRDGVNTMALVNGMPDIRTAVVPHPIGSVEEPELRERAILAASQFREIILAQPVDREREPVLETAGESPA